MITRRDFLGLRPVLPQPLDSPEPPSSGLAPYAGPWLRPQAAHLLRRATFGAAWAEVENSLALGLDATVAALLQPEAPPPPPVNDYNDADFTDSTVPWGATWVNEVYGDEAEGYRLWSLKSWWITRILTQSMSLHQKMLLFWFNHVPVQIVEVFNAHFAYRYYSTLHTHALGNVKQLMKALTLEPCMLLFLNGQYNSAGAPDENYARELQELFCIGKGPNANFMEADVQAAARVLTGWRFDWTTGAVYMNSAEHDSGTKLFTTFYGNAVIVGGTGAAAEAELDALLDILFANDECALFLCRKLYHFFVQHDIDAAVEQNVIVPLAQTLRANDYDIVPVLAQLFKSAHFHDALIRGAMLKNPAEYTLGMFRELQATFPPAEAFGDRKMIGNTLQWAMSVMGMDMGDPPSVAGWPAYYQLPLFDKLWVNTNSLPLRGQIADWTLWGGIATENYNVQFDVLATVGQIPNAANPNALIDTLADWLYGMAVPDALKAQLKAILLSGQLSDYYWSSAWNAYVASPDDAGAEMIVLNRLRPFFYVLLHQEEYQLL